ncbi:quinone-dependent dihydroorotate dehydrogenase [Zhengella sp. ZM62]|uniref:quinone-dependent dihydroorotate dehydrogenase n=1 Tax=Zhengella sedimenti TaxID=3390035 RepID=UPI0039747F63
MIGERLGLALLFRFSPETAHGLSITALKAGLGGRFDAGFDPRLATTVCGLTFPNPLGMAAGYDKNGEVPDALLRLGFGFAEVGTVTPLAQPGNPKPRIFRLPQDRGVINRLGFNNEGHAACLARLKARADRGGIVGVNIGANKDSADRVADYVKGVEVFAPLASYLTVNVSSPNTPGLRNLQSRESLGDLLARVKVARDASATATGKAPPVFLKVAPDLSEAELDDIAEEVLDKGTDGLIVSNTTLARDRLADTAAAREAGGLSGRPVFRRSTAVLAKLRKRVGPSLPIIGVGGVEDAATALEKIRAGADLVQLYSCMIYGGPGLPRRILQGLSAFLDREGIDHPGALRDTGLEQWASTPL